MIALDLGVPNATLTIFNETSTHNIDSLSYDSSSGLLYGVSTSVGVAEGTIATISYLVAVDSAGFTWKSIGRIGENMGSLNGYGVIGGGEVVRVWLG